MNKKIFAFDLDGTYIKNDNKTLPQTLKALRIAKQKGHYLVLATGRPLADVKGVVEGWEMFDYLVGNNGAFCFDFKANKYVKSHILDKDVVRDFVKFARHKDILLTLHTMTGSFRFNMSDTTILSQSISKQEKIFKKISNIDEFMKNFDKYDYCQASYRSTIEIVNHMIGSIRERFNTVDIVIANEYYIDINPKNINKYVGVKEIADSLGVSNDNIIAFGDSDNDLEFLEKSGKSFAMSNGTDSAKNAADEVIGNNRTTAIADKVNKILENL